MISIKAKVKEGIPIAPEEQVFLQHESFVEKSFANLKKHSFVTLGCTFQQCDFTKMRAVHVAFASGTEHSLYVECNFTGMRVRRPLMGQVRFERCTFRDVMIEGMFTHGAEFVDCIFTGKLSKSVFFGRVTAGEEEVTARRINEFHGNDFAEMHMSDVDFRMGIDLGRQKLPTGENYLYLRNAAPKLAALRAKYLQKAPSELRENVFKFLQYPEELVRDGQRDLFICKDSHVHISKSAIDTIWRELSEMSG